MGLSRRLSVLGLTVMSLAGMAAGRVDTLRQGLNGYTGCTDTYVHWYDQNGYGCDDNSRQTEMKAQSG